MLTLLLLVALITVTVQGESITSIISGTGFGSCTGYCYQTMTINPTTIVTLKTSKTDQTTYPNVQQVYSVDSSLFNELVGLVGNIQLWKSVDSPIGCPDCDNQGYEWIDVYTDTQPKYGVVFEHSATIPDYVSLVNRLRALRLQYFTSA
jgi:hypothetical protein